MGVSRGHRDPSHPLVSELRTLAAGVDRVGPADYRACAPTNSREGIAFGMGRRNSFLLLLVLLAHLLDDPLRRTAPSRRLPLVASCRARRRRVPRGVRFVTGARNRTLGTAV